MILWTGDCWLADFPQLQLGEAHDCPWAAVLLRPRHRDAHGKLPLGLSLGSLSPTMWSQCALGGWYCMVLTPFQPPSNQHYRLVTGLTLHSLASGFTRCPGKAQGHHRRQGGHPAVPSETHQKCCCDDCATYPCEHIFPSQGTGS